MIIVETSVNLIGSVEMRVMLNRLPADLQRELRPRLRQAAELVAADARRRAGAWSSRIPDAIKVRTSFGVARAGATVVVDSKVAPHARAYEGIATRGSSFRHPVFGTDRWVDQATRPFLIPAGQAKEAEAARLAAEAINAVVARAGD